MGEEITGDMGENKKPEVLLTLSGGSIE